MELIVQVSTVAPLAMVPTLPPLSEQLPKLPTAPDSVAVSTALPPPPEWLAVTVNGTPIVAVAGAEGAPIGVGKRGWRFGRRRRACPWRAPGLRGSRCV